MKQAGRLRTTLFVAAALASAGWAYWNFAIPTHRVGVQSELVMLGDLDGDHRWASGDLVVLDTFLSRRSGRAMTSPGASI